MDSNRPRASKTDIYYSQTASSLSKRPLGDLYSDKDKKGGERSAANRPSTKKNFHNVTSKIDCGTKKKSITASAGLHQSDGLTAKRKDELFGRVSQHTLAKFLNKKYT
jgi:hypothetical protein